MALTMAKGISCTLAIALILVLKLAFVSANDPSPLQDFCVAVSESKSSVFVNGKFCKNPKYVTPNDFYFSGLDKPANIGAMGFKVTQVNVEQIPGLNTLGVSLARIDFAPNGLNPPHFHPRGTEILAVAFGTLFVGFITSNPKNRLVSKQLSQGDVFVFPQGLIHFQYNLGDTSAVAFSGFSGQNPGVITVGNAVFGSDPFMNDDMLSKAFQVDRRVIDFLEKQKWEDDEDKD